MENTMLFKALREFTTGLLNQLLVNLAGQDGQMWLEEFKKFLRQEACWGKQYLRRVCEFTVDPTDGTETLPGLPASGKPTPAVKVIVWEVTLDGTFAQLFGSLVGKRRRWTTSQVAKFTKQYPSKLLGKSCESFFELTDGFVVRVDVNGSRPYADVCRFSYYGVWEAKFKHRLFSLR